MIAIYSALGRRVPLLCAGLLLVLGSTACETAPAQPQRSTVYQGGTDIAGTQPVDVAVVPVRNQSGVEGVPVEILRSEIYRGLPERLYSPLELGFVDAGWGEASWSVDLGADAILGVIVTGWDTTWLENNGALFATLEVSLLDGSSAEMETLWSVVATRRVDLGTVPEAERWERAAEVLAGEVLRLIPERKAGGG